VPLCAALVHSILNATMWIQAASENVRGAAVLECHDRVKKKLKVVAFNTSRAEDDAGVVLLDAHVKANGAAAAGTPIDIDGLRWHVAAFSPRVFECCRLANRRSIRVVLTDVAANPAVRGIRVAEMVDRDAKEFESKNIDPEDHSLIGGTLVPDQHPDADGCYRNVGYEEGIADQRLRVSDHDIITLYDGDAPAAFKAVDQAPEPRAWATNDGIAMLGSGSWYHEAGQTINILHGSVPKAQIERYMRELQSHDCNVAAFLLLPAGTVLHLTTMVEQLPRIPLGRRVMVDMAEHVKTEVPMVAVVLFRREWQHLFDIINEASGYPAGCPCNMYLPDLWDRQDDYTDSNSILFKGNDKPDKPCAR
jgi:hypothetical protein